MTICFKTSLGSTRPPVTRVTMLSTSLRSRRPSVTKTDGNPLFVEELTKTVLEAGILVEGR